MTTGDDAPSSLGEHERSLLSDAFEDAPFEFWVRDLDGRCVIANASCRRLGAILSTKVEDAPVPPELISAWQTNNQRALRGEVVQNEFEYGEGEAKRYLQCHIVPLRIAGEIKGVLGFNIDITNHRRTEQALRESELRLGEALRVGHMGWLDWDLVTNEIRWSPQTYRLFGYEPGGTFTPTIDATIGMVPVEDRELVEQRLTAAIEGKSSYDIVHRIVRGDGKVIYVHALGEIMRDDAGSPLRLLGTVIDVTERVQAEHELREVDRVRSEFLALLSHELRNPLAVIRTGLSCVAPPLVQDDQARRVLAAIDRQTRHLSRLVDDLLDLTRVRSGKISLQCMTIDLAGLVRATVDDHRELLAGREVTLDVPDVPVWVNGDATRLAQILGNLLHNAAKFTPAPGRVSVSLATTNGRSVLAVSDSGVGIDREFLEKLFVPFAQADRSLDRSRRGLGLGLALVKTLVGLHDGEVRADSAGPGRGTSITVTIPLTQRTGETPPAPLPTAPTPRTILIIEDDEDVAEWLQTALALSGHRVTVTHDGDAGIAKAREIAPDVILCDLGLPGARDGFAIARELRQNEALAAAYRIALSGFTQPEDQAKARAAGFEAHLAKPPDMAALERLLAELPRR